MYNKNIAKLWKGVRTIISTKFCNFNERNKISELPWILYAKPFKGEKLYVFTVAIMKTKKGLAVNIHITE